MLHFATDGRFALFDVTSPVDGVVTDFRKPVGAKVDAVVNRGYVLVIYQLRSLLDIQIPRSTIHDLVVLPNQLQGHCHIMDVCW